MIKKHVTRDRHRTNIFIQDNSLWNWAKYQSRMKQFPSISDYIFQLIKHDRYTNILDSELLQELELYFELNSYTLGDIANRIGTTIEYINEFLIEKKIPIDDTKTALNIIHNQLIQSKVTPREIFLLNNLNNLLKHTEDFPKRRELLLVFIDDAYIRRNEIYAKALDFLNYIVDKTQRAKRNLSEERLLKYNKTNFPTILYQLGIDPSEEKNLYENEYYKMLKEQGIEHYFFFAFDLAGWTIIYQTTTQIITFITTLGIGGIIQIITKKIEELFQYMITMMPKMIEDEPEPIKKDFYKVLANI